MIDLVLKVLEVLLSKSLVFEEFLAELSAQLLLERVEIGIDQPEMAAILCD